MKIIMTHDDRTASADLFNATDHPDKAVSLLMMAAMTILQRRYGAGQAIEHMTRALDVAGAEVRRAIHGS